MYIMRGFSLRISYREEKNLPSLYSQTPWKTNKIDAIVNLQIITNNLVLLKGSPAKLRYIYKGETLEY